MRWSDAARPSTDRKLREFAITGTTLLVASAMWRGMLPGSLVLPACLAALAIALAAIGLARPRWLAPVFTACMIAVFPIAWLVSHLALAMIYFGVITPLGLVFRLVGRDVFGRAWDKKAATNWREKPAAQRSERYLRQF